MSAEHSKDCICLKCTAEEAAANAQKPSSLAAMPCSPAHVCTHNIAKGVECRKPATHRVTRDGDNSLEWFFCEEHASQRKAHIYTVTALENAPHKRCGRKSMSNKSKIICN